MRRALAVLALCVFPVVASAADDDAIRPEERYELCLKYLQRGVYTKALEQCNRVRNYHRDDPASVKAELAIADIYFQKGDFEQARFAYEDFSRLHPRHDNLDFVTFRIGLCHDKRASHFAGRDQADTRAALAAWAGYARRFPESEHVDETERRYARALDRLASKELWIAKFYAKRGAWRAVRGRAEYLVSRYPESNLVPEALALLGESLHRWGEIDAAADVRQRLAEAAPDTAALARLDRALSRPAGEPPEEETFFRPYRVPGFTPVTTPGM